MLKFKISIFFIFWKRKKKNRNRTEKKWTEPIWTEPTRNVYSLILLFFQQLKAETYRKIWRFIMVVLHLLNDDNPKPQEPNPSHPIPTQAQPARHGVYHDPSLFLFYTLTHNPRSVPNAQKSFHLLHAKTALTLSLGLCFLLCSPSSDFRLRRRNTRVRALAPPSLQRGLRSLQCPLLFLCLSTPQLGPPLLRSAPEPNRRWQTQNAMVSLSFSPKIETLDVVFFFDWIRVWFV